LILHDKKIIFVHIPKTGGGTIHKVFGQDFKGPENHYDGMTEVLCKEYFMFTFVRNPFERFVSSYLYWKDSRKLLSGISFLDYAKDLESIFAERCIEEEVVHTWDMSYLNGHKDKWQYMDFIGRFESFENDLRLVMHLAGYDYKGDIPKEHQGSFSRNGYPYQSYYCDESRYLVEKRFSKDLLQFMYKF